MFNQIISVWLINDNHFQPTFDQASHKAWSKSNSLSGFKRFRFAVGLNKFSIRPKSFSADFSQLRFHRRSVTNSKWGFYCAFHKCHSYLYCYQMKSWIVHSVLYCCGGGLLHLKVGEVDLILISPNVERENLNLIVCLRSSRLLFCVFCCRNYYHPQQFSINYFVMLRNRII